MAVDVWPTVFTGPNYYNSGCSMVCSGLWGSLALADPSHEFEFRFSSIGIQRLLRGDNPALAVSIGELLSAVTKLACFLFFRASSLPTAEWSSRN